MKDFFEITDMDRADLTRGDVSNAIAYELMRAGIPKPILLEDEKEAPVNVPTITMYVVELSAKAGYNSDIPDLAYETNAEALAAGEAMVKGARMTNTSWTGGTTYKIIDVDATFSVKAVDFANKYDVDRVEATLKENSAIRNRNEDARKKYRDAANKSTSVSDPIWEKYNESLSIASKVDEMRQTHADYIELAGDEETAMKFFVNAHEPDDVRLYEEWTQIECFQQPLMDKMEEGDDDVEEKE